MLVELAVVAPLAFGAGLIAGFLLADRYRLTRRDDGRTGSDP